MNFDRYNKILGLGEFQPQQKYVCFLPFIGEFGWYIQNFVKRVYAYNHLNKIVCTKRGHEALFPNALEFYYDWQDVHDSLKAGVLTSEDQENALKLKLMKKYGYNIFFISPHETSWEEKETLSSHIFIPKAKTDNNLEVDVVLAPRNRQVDINRNWTIENWQLVVDKLNAKNLRVGVVGARDTSFELNNVLYKSYDYTDVDSDIEMISKARLVIVQESGLQYLSFLCQKPTMCIDNYLATLGSEDHRPKDIFFKDVRHVWDNPNHLVDEIINYLGQQYY